MLIYCNRQQADKARREELFAESDADVDQRRYDTQLSRRWWDEQQEEAELAEEREKARAQQPAGLGATTGSSPVAGAAAVGSPGLASQASSTVY
jgi:hypothetical protein